jgi:hypothetical protein
MYVFAKARSNYNLTNDRITFFLTKILFRIKKNESFSPSKLISNRITAVATVNIRLVKDTMIIYV